MLKHVYRMIRNHRGVAAMEFAIVSPILLLIVFATIEYGWYLTHWTVLTHAVAEGARAGVKAREWESDTHAAEDPKQFVRDALSDALWTHPELDVESETYIDIEVIEADDVGPRRIQVKAIDIPYKPITGYLGKNMLPQILAAKAVMAFP